LKSWGGKSFHFIIFQISNFNFPSAAKQTNQKSNDNIISEDVVNKKESRKKHQLV